MAPSLGLMFSKLISCSKSIWSRSCDLRCRGLNVRVPQIHALTPKPNVLMLEAGLREVVSERR